MKAANLILVIFSGLLLLLLAIINPTESRHFTQQPHLKNGETKASIFNTPRICKVECFEGRECIGGKCRRVVYK